MKTNQILIICSLMLLASSASSLENSNIVITAKAIECFPQYQCEEWGECVEGLESRTCQDTECNMKEIVERRFCDNLSCRPQIKCTEWTECAYTDKTDDIFAGKIKFGGYKSRECSDLIGCVDSFSEESSCEESFDLELRKTRECNIDYMVAVDPSSGKEIAKISLDSWRSNKLDVVFTRGRTSYCPACYNGIKDASEENIDCGGECKLCKEEKNFPITAFILSFWTLSLIFSVLIVREISHSRKEITKEYRKKSKLGK